MKWEKKLNEWTYREVPADTVNKVKPRVALRELEKALAGKGAVVSTDIGNICSVSNSYLRFDGMSRPQMDSTFWTEKYIVHQITCCFGVLCLRQRGLTECFITLIVSGHGGVVVIESGFRSVHSFFLIFAKGNIETSCLHIPSCKIIHFLLTVFTSCTGRHAQWQCDLHRAL